MMGWLIINKEPHMLSMDVVRKIKFLFPKEKIGHAGTLDPFATGILPIAFGYATKMMNFIASQDKEYVFDVIFGKTTDTLDCDGKITIQDQPIPSMDVIQSTIKDFMGNQLQVPPHYSAVKVHGKRSYDLARKGNFPSLKPKNIIIFDIKCLRYTAPVATFWIKCGHGTYVRSLARDMAKKLGTVGYVSALHRSRVAGWDIKSSISLAKIAKLSHKEVYQFILPMNSVLNEKFMFHLTNHQAEKLLKDRHLVILSPPEQQEFEGCAVYENQVLALVKYSKGLLKLRKVFQ